MSTSLSIARSLVGVREDPPASNRGEYVERILKECGIAPPAPWCAAFVYHCIAEAAKSGGLTNPFAKMKGKAWTPDWLEWANDHGETLTGRRAKLLADGGRCLFDTKFEMENAGSKPSRIESRIVNAATSSDEPSSAIAGAADSSSGAVLMPGMFFLLYFPRLKRVAHIGFIASPLDALMLVEFSGNGLAIGDKAYASRFRKRIEAASTNETAKLKLADDCERAVASLLARGLVATIEGNTDPAGSRTGGGVFIRTRKLAGMHRIAGY
jgi:hypothetical protein